MSEHRWLRHARARLLDRFPTLPRQTGYNKRLRTLDDTMSWLIGTLHPTTPRTAGNGQEPIL